MENEGKYKVARIEVADNGYWINLNDYKGVKIPMKSGIKVAKTIEELAKILKSNLITLVD